MYPVFVLPWGAKIIVDHVVLQRPIESTDGYPIWLHPLIEHFMTVSSLEILITLTVISVFLIILVGGYAPGAANDTTDGGMIEGQDTATKQENLTHGGHSFAGGIWGYYEYKNEFTLDPDGEPYGSRQAVRADKVNANDFARRPTNRRFGLPRYVRRSIYQPNLL